MIHSQITEHIWCGGELRPEDWERLYHLGVRYDLSLQKRRDDFGALTPEGELWLPARDWYMPTLDQLAMAVHFLSAAVAMNKKTVVHCRWGIGRAPLTVACFLVAHEGMTTRKAIDFVRERRPVVAPNHGQVEVVREFERLWRAGDCS
jgi:atypical dual specificity phosphatase